MKRLLASAILAVGFLPSAVSAQTLWRMDAFRADIRVGADGVVEVQETIGADFTTPRHGLYRYVPISGKNEQGGDYRLDVSLVSVTRDGAPEPVSTSEKGNDLVWQIGRANTLLNGTHAYVITYDVRGAIGSFKDFDELYWNVTGDGWDVPLPIVTATVSLPTGTSVLQSACYTGPAGSTAKDCQIISASGQAGFITKSSNEPLTIAVGIPKGSVPILTPTAPGARASFVGPSAPPTAFGLFLRTILPLLLLAAGCGWFYLSWRAKGRDAPLGAIVAQYEPPDGLRPSEINMLLNQATTRAGIDLAPTIIDLAVRGYLRIEETTRGLVFKEKAYVFHLLKEYDADPGLHDFERSFLQAMFASAVGIQSDVTDTQLGLSGFSSRLQNVGKTLRQSITDDGYLDAAAAKTKDRYSVIGLLVAFFDLFFFFAVLVLGPVWFVSIFLFGVICVVYGRYMAKWTDKGRDAAWRALGYKEFISSVEKYRAPWMETQEVFEKTLPYAMAFGLGKKWAAAFERLQMTPPSWYQSAHAGAWSALAFHQSLQSFSGAFATHSGTSGSGGRGHSGGGGGGGGGGSW